jgi:hypothetical protein
VAIALGIILGVARIASARADSLASVSCDGFVLGYTGAADKKSCRTGDLTGNAGQNVAGTVSQIEVTNRDFYLVVTYEEGKFRTYFPGRSPREEVDSNPSLKAISNWQSKPSIRGFEVALFDAVATQSNAIVSCAIFVGHGAPLGGPYEYPDGPGYKTVLAGYYCPASINVQADAFMNSLEDAIDKLQLPPQ